MPPGHRLAWIVAAIALVAAAGASFFLSGTVRQIVFSIGERSAAVRGRAVAERMGCFGCHGEGGTRGISNPGSREGEVPSWDGGTLMMYAKDRTEIEAWILDGAPPRVREAPDYVSKRRAAAVAMPAYRGRISGRGLSDLVAYFEAQALAVEPDDPAALRGKEVARATGCFGCHGAEGRGRLANPGSFKGYVPGWDGDDFAELVRSDEELREWIEDGTPRRLASSWLARRFLDAQALRMPAYGRRLSSDQISDLIAYLRWMRIRAYPK